MGIAMEYQGLSGEALLSNYKRTDVFDQNPTLRIATAVVNRSDQMFEAIATNGHTFHFEARIERQSSGSEHTELPVVDVAAMTIKDGDPGGTVEIRTVPDNPELEDLVSAAERLSEPRRGSFRVWLKDVYQSSRGFEIGTLNSSLGGDHEASVGKVERASSGLHLRHYDACS